MLSSPVQNVEVNLYARPTQNVSINFRFVADDSDDRKRTRDGSFKSCTHHLEASQQDDERAFCVPIAMLSEHTSSFSRVKSMI